MVAPWEQAALPDAPKRAPTCTWFCRVAAETLTCCRELCYHMARGCLSPRDHFCLRDLGAAT